MRVVRPAVILAAILVLSYFISLGAGPNAPAITAENASWDFGSVPSDFKVIHFFKIKNTGSDKLKISKTLANCDCTTASAIDTLVPPGGTTDVRILFNTKEYYGTTNRIISVYSNDPAKPVLNLDYSANIDYFHKMHTCEPKYLTFISAQDSKQVKLINNSDTRISYSIGMEPDSIFSLDQTQGTISPKSAAPITVTVKSNLRKGTYYSNFTVTYNTTPPLRLTVPVKIARF